MGRPPWATAEQTEYLQNLVSRLDEEKQNHGLAAFYARTTTEFLKRWPSLLVPDGMKSDDELRSLADKQKGKVSLIHSTYPNC